MEQRSSRRSSTRPSLVESTIYSAPVRAALGRRARRGAPRPVRSSRIRRASERDAKQGLAGSQPREMGHHDVSRRTDLLDEAQNEAEATLRLHGVTALDRRRFVFLSIVAGRVHICLAPARPRRRPGPPAGQGAPAGSLHPPLGNGEPMCWAFQPWPTGAERLFATGAARSSARPRSSDRAVDCPTRSFLPAHRRGAPQGKPPDRDALYRSHQAPDPTLLCAVTIAEEQAPPKPRAPPTTRSGRYRGRSTDPKAWDPFSTRASARRARLTRIGHDETRRSSGCARPAPC